MFRKSIGECRLKQLEKVLCRRWGFGGCERTERTSHSRGGRSDKRQETQAGLGEVGCASPGPIIPTGAGVGSTEGTKQVASLKLSQIKEI